MDQRFLPSFQMSKGKVDGIDADVDGRKGGVVGKLRRLQKRLFCSGGGDVVPGSSSTVLHRSRPEGSIFATPSPSLELTRQSVVAASKEGIYEQIAGRSMAESCRRVHSWNRDPEDGSPAVKRRMPAAGDGKRYIDRTATGSFRRMPSAGDGKRYINRTAAVSFIRNQTFVLDDVTRMRIPDANEEDRSMGGRECFMGRLNLSITTTSRRQIIVNAKEAKFDSLPQKFRNGATFELETRLFDGQVGSLCRKQNVLSTSATGSGCTFNDVIVYNVSPSSTGVSRLQISISQCINNVRQSVGSMEYSWSSQMLDRSGRNSAMEEVTLIDGWHVLYDSENSGDSQADDNKENNTTSGCRTLVSRGVGPKPIQIAIPPSEGSKFGFTVRGSRPVQVARVKPDCKAAKMGLEDGDCIVGVNGKNVARSTTKSVALLIRESSDQHPLVLDVVRASDSGLGPSMYEHSSSSNTHSFQTGISKSIRETTLQQSKIVKGEMRRVETISQMVLTEVRKEWRTDSHLDQTGCLDETSGGTVELDLESLEYGRGCGKRLKRSSDQLERRNQTQMDTSVVVSMASSGHLRAGMYYKWDPDMSDISGSSDLSPAPSSTTLVSSSVVHSPSELDNARFESDTSGSKRSILDRLPESRDHSTTLTDDSMTLGSPDASMFTINDSNNNNNNNSNSNNNNNSNNNSWQSQTIRSEDEASKLDEFSRNNSSVSLRRSLTSKLLNLERGFLASMTSGIQSFARPLKGHILTATQHGIIFQNIEKLVMFARLQESMLSRLSPDSDPVEVYADRFQMLSDSYSAYIDGLPPAIHLLRRLSIEDVELVKYLREQQSSAEFPLSLEEFLRRPVDHLFQLSTLLQLPNKSS